MRLLDHSDAVSAGYQMGLVQLFGGAGMVHQVQPMRLSDHLDAVGVGYQMCLVQLFACGELVHQV